MIYQMALDYAARGWLVIPLYAVQDGVCGCCKADCKSPGKHPRTKNGLKDASADRRQILKWFSAERSLSNVGIVTGTASRLFVVDVDGAEAMKVWEAFQARYELLPPSYRALTGRVDGAGNRTGCHLYYCLRAGVAAPPNSQGAIGPGVDVRGEGGYVVAPPSMHASGRVYRWDEDSAYELAERGAIVEESHHDEQ